MKGRVCCCCYSHQPSLFLLGIELHPLLRCMRVCVGFAADACCAGGGVSKCSKRWHHVDLIRKLCLVGLCCCVLQQYAFL